MSFWKPKNIYKKKLNLFLEFYNKDYLFNWWVGFNGISTRLGLFTPQC